MTCPNCASETLPDSSYCHRCGFRITPNTVASLSERLTKLEQDFVAKSRKEVTEQKYLETETSVNIMGRVQHWTNLILYFAGIPAALGLLALAVMFGKGAFDLHTI